nr:hypothetical protein [Tanacetum cinerariifolium]
MVDILEKTKHKTDFHQIVDFLKASHIRYALTVHPTVYVSHIRQFWSTARVETTDGENNVISKSKFPSPGANETAFPTGNARYGDAFPTVTRLDARQDRKNIAKTSAMPHEGSPMVTSLVDSKGRGMDQGEDLLVGDIVKDSDKSANKGSDSTDEMANVLGTLGATNILDNGGLSQFLSLPVYQLPLLVSPAVATASGGFPVAVILPLPVKKDKGKRKMTEPKQPSKEKVLEQMSVQLARDLEVKFAQEELDRSNEMVAKYLCEYEQAEAGLSHDEKIEKKFIPVWEKMQDFVPMNSKLESKGLKRLEIQLGKESFKKLKTAEASERIWIDFGVWSRRLAAQQRSLMKKRRSFRIVPLLDTMLIHQGEGSGTPTEPHHTPFPESSTLLTVADEPASPVRDDSQGEACPTDSGFITDQDRATITKSSTLPYDSAPRVTSPTAVEGKEEIGRLKERVQVLEDREAVASKPSREDAPINGRSNNEGEAAAERITAERISNDSEEIARVLTFMDAATVLAGETNIPTGSGFIPTTGPPATVPLLVQLLEEERERKLWMNEQIARDAEVVRIHAEEEIQGMIDSLDKSNETIAKYLQEYQQFASELPLEKKIELINDLVKYQEHYTKRFKDFKGMSFEEIEAMFAKVWKQVEDFIPMGSKEEAERLKRK